MTPLPHAGQPNLSECDKEPIHRLGRIQPFGFLIGFSLEWTITHISENAAAFFGIPAAQMLGRPAKEFVASEALHKMRNSLQMLRGRSSVEVLDDLELVAGRDAVDISLHMSDDVVVVECEPAQPHEHDQTGASVRRAIQRLSRESDPQRVARMAAIFVAEQFRFDKVMVYRFLNDDSGEVIAEVCPSDMESYQGLRFPASDIPKQARALYLRTPIRLIADAGEPGIPILAAGEPQDGDILDLTLSALRSVSPVHLEYLRNMDVAASMSISIIVDGRLWGLIACHHRIPKVLSRRERNAADLFGQMFSLLLQARLNDDMQQVDQAVEDLIADIHQTVDLDASIGGTLLTCAQKFAPLIQADGLAILLDGHVTTEGAAPPKSDIRNLLPVLKEVQSSRIFTSSCLTDLLPGAADYAEECAGLLALPISKRPGDYVLFFRRELAKTVNWAGNPDKAASISKTGERISPRKSFEVWRQNVRGRSDEWSRQEIRAANQLRIALLEIVLRMAEEAAQERRANQEKQELVVSELNHRVRNILGLVRGLIAQSSPRSGNTADFVAILDSRIQALARAHDQLTRENWSPASLRELITIEAESYLTEGRNRVVVSGGDIALSPVAFSTFALVIHELLTNSMKHGALSDSSGDVKVTIQHEDGQPLVFHWQEEGGPTVTPPTRRGFGSTVIERSIPFELKGKAEVDFAPEGLRAHFEIPISHIFEIEPSVSNHMEPDIQGDDVVLSPATILVVEDNLIIAMDAEAIFRQLGAQDVHLAASNEEARAILDTHQIDFALLDVNLGDSTSYLTAEVLRRRDIPFAFASGYGEGTEAPDGLRDYSILAKPYFQDSVKRLLADMQGPRTAH